LRIPGLLEINQIRHISASVQMDESTATQVGYYAAFIHASANDVVDKALNYVLSKDVTSKTFCRRHRPSRLLPSCASVKARIEMRRMSTEQPAKKLVPGVESKPAVREVKA
jgi:hypothetical protein